MKIVYTIEELVNEPTRHRPKMKKPRVRNVPGSFIDVFSLMDMVAEQQDKAPSRSSTTD